MQHQLHPCLFEALSPYFRAGAGRGARAPGVSPSAEPERKVQAQPRPPETRRGHPGGNDEQRRQPGPPASRAPVALVLPSSSPRPDAPGEPGRAVRPGPGGGVSGG